MAGDETAPQEHGTEGNSLRQRNVWPRYEMDWASLQSALDRAQEHVAVGERLIARQKELIAELASRGADVSRSESLLATFEALQRLHLVHRDGLARRLEERRKSAFAERQQNFADIDSRYAAEAIETRSLGRKLDHQTSYAEAMIRTIREPLVVVDEELRVVTASESFYRFFAALPAGTLGRRLPDTDRQHFDTPTMRAFLGRVKAGDHSRETFEIEIDAPALGRRVVAVTAEPINDVDATDKKILISFSDVTEFRRAVAEFAVAKQAAEHANLVKSRLLAAASHDLREPLQALSLLRAALRRRVTDPEALSLIEREDRASKAIFGMLELLLDINRLEAGVIEPLWAEVPIEELFDTLNGEFAEQARSKGLGWRVVLCKLAIRSDRRLLEDMVRNLLSNALRYTDRGKILLGCRRSGERLRIEVCDTGVGIPEDQISLIFEEYRTAGEGDRRGGFGLGLAIVKSLGELLAHPVGVRSRLGKGSVFYIETQLASAPLPPSSIEAQQTPSDLLTGSVLVIEDEPSVRGALEAMLRAEGHRVAAVATGQAALDLIAAGGPRPDLAITGYDLPGGINGLEAVSGLRSALGRQAPAIILSGDVRAAKQSEIAASGCVDVAKPVDAAVLSRLVQRLLAGSGATLATQPPKSAAHAIFVVDDDRGTREAVRVLLADAGYAVKTYASASAFLNFVSRRGQRLPHYRCPHARHERTRNAGAARGGRQQDAGDRDHRARRHRHGRLGHAGGSRRFHRKAGPPGGAARGNRSRVSAGGQSRREIGAPRRGDDARRVADQTRARGDASCRRRRSQQGDRRSAPPQPAHGRNSSRHRHEKVGSAVDFGPCSLGGRGGGMNGRRGGVYWLPPDPFIRSLERR